MNFRLIHWLSFSSLLMGLLACGKTRTSGSDSGSDLDSIENKGSEKFNLAEFVGQNPKTPMLYKAVSPGSGFLFFGEKNKFRLETNMTLDTQGEKGIFIGGPRGISAAYWLDGYVFGKRIGGQRDKGNLVDVGANGQLENLSLEAYVRFLGDDKYRGKIDSILERKFVRDLSLETVYYPVPLLGIKASGNIGGELGFKADPGNKAKNIMNLIFTPKSTFSAGLSSGLELLRFASAEVKGVVNLMTIDIASTANLGFLNEANFSYGHTGVDGGELKALDGKITIEAKAAVPGFLPADIDAKLWNYAAKKAGIELPKYEWVHTVWDPIPVDVKDLPAFGNPFMKFTAKPKNQADCSDKVALIKEQLNQHTAALQKNGVPSSGTEAAMNSASLDYLNDIKDKVSTSCESL